MTAAVPRPWQGLTAVLLAAAASQVAGGLGLLGAMFLWPQPEVDFAAFDAASMPFVWIVGSTLALQGVLALFALAVPWLMRAPVATTLSLTKAPLWTLPLAPLGAVALGPFADLLMQGAAYVVGDVGDGNVAMILGVARAEPYWATLPVIALLPGFAEEFLFRGVLQRSLGPGWRGWVIASAVFALFHLDPVHVAGVFPVGLYLGWLFRRCGSLWVPIAAHVGNNAFSIVAANLPVFDVGYGSPHPTPVSWIPVGLLVCGAVIWAMDRWVPVRSAVAPFLDPS